MSNQGMMIRVLTPAPSLTFIDLLPDAFEPKYLDEVKGDGAGAFRLHQKDPRLVEFPNLGDSRNVVQQFVDGKIRGAWVMRNQHEILVGKGEEAALFTEFSGPGLRDWLHDAVLYPTGAFSGSTRATSNRFFNFSSAAGSWYKAANWVAPVSMTTKLDETTWDKNAGTGNPWKLAPVGWPDAPLAKWIWDRNTRLLAGAPIGDVYFRKLFTSTAISNYALYVTADDNFQAFIDGVPIVAVKSTYGWTQLYRGDIVLSPGNHVLAIRATNTGGPAALLAALYSFGDPKEAVPAVLLTYTGDTGWLCNAYPVEAPGWTPGEILRVLMEEAKVRGVSSFQSITLGFTDTLDSNGQPWATVLDWAFPIGVEYIEIIERLEELAVEVSFDPETFKMLAYNAQGVERSVQTTSGEPIAFRRGHNVTAASEDTEAVLKNVFLMGFGDDELTEVIDPHKTVPLYGRIEGYVATDNQTDKPKATLIGSKMLEMTKAPTDAASITITDVEGHTPWTDFQKGDWVQGPSGSGIRRRRVISIAVSGDKDTGVPLYEVELDTLLQDRNERIEKFLRRLPAFQPLGQEVSAGSVGGGGSGTGGSVGDGGYSGGLPGSGSGYGGTGGTSTTSMGGGLVYVQPNEPLGVPIGTLWYDTDSWYGEGAPA